MSSNSAFISHPEWGEVAIMGRFEGFTQVKDLGGAIRYVNPKDLNHVSPPVAINNAVMQESIAADPPPTDAPDINTLTADQLARAVSVNKVVARKIISSRPPTGFSSLEHLRELVGDVSLSDDVIRRLGGLRYETRSD